MGTIGEIRYTKHVYRRRRGPEEYPTAVAAIRSHCLECCGYSAPEVDKCTAPACWLYPWRFGCGPERAARQGKKV